MPIIELSVGGTRLSVRRASGRFALSELFSLEVSAAADDPPAAADLLGAPFELTLHDAFERALCVRGVVVRVQRVPGESGASFALSLAPEVAPLAVGRDSRVFQDLSCVEVVKQVFTAAALPADHVRWAVSGSYPKRAYCVQYRESDWDFVARLLAEEGIHFWFDFTAEATMLVFSDDSTAAPEIEDGAAVPFHDDDVLRATRDSVIRVRRAATLAPDAVRLRDYSFKKPRLKLESTAGAGAHELYDFPGRFAAPREGERLAKTRIESLRARCVSTSGETSSARLRPGLVFELTDHPVEAVNGRLLITSVAFTAWEARTQEDEIEAPLRQEWTAIPATVPFRPARERVTAGPSGPQTGVVVGAPGEEIHADESGRIRVQFYWDREGKRDDKASTWMRVGQFALGGSMVLPRLGWDVLVHHHEGDIDAPLVLSHLYDGQHPVPYALPANKTRSAWQTATTPGGGSTNELRFEDKAGQEEMFINASKDMNVVTGDKKGEKIGNNYKHKIGSNREVKIGSNLVHGVAAKQDVTIGASESLTVSGSRSMTVNGSETASIGGSRSVTTTSGLTYEAKGGRSLTVGSTLLAAAAMEHNRTAVGTMSVTVGGSAIVASATGIENTTGGAAAETVGGAKIQLGASGCETSVKGVAAETVGGAYVIAAGGNAAESATGPLAVTVGGAFLANAPSIEVEADDEISFRVGGSSLVIKSGSIEVKGPTLASPGAVIDKKAGNIRHN
ncbi:hypothetical protein BE04_24705 [Sorangium cellulosum]|uniref:Uncharacterized protein n=1 Tax=Sorangium cellulosum TaxID=56 RepID=A0A150P2S0_SORCE|nr:hypothetical protein BE04_24705 [Sorangium cellulosum]